MKASFALSCSALLLLSGVSFGNPQIAQISETLVPETVLDAEGVGCSRPNVPSKVMLEGSWGTSYNVVGVNNNITYGVVDSDAWSLTSELKWTWNGIVQSKGSQEFWSFGHPQHLCPQHHHHHRHLQHDHHHCHPHLPLHWLSLACCLSGENLEIFDCDGNTLAKVEEDLVVRSNSWLTPHNFQHSPLLVHSISRTLAL